MDWQWRKNKNMIVTIKTDTVKLLTVSKRFVFYNINVNNLNEHWTVLINFPKDDRWLFVNNTINSYPLCSK